MLETITTPKITLKELEKKFELKLVTAPDFFYRIPGKFTSNY